MRTFWNDKEQLKREIEKVKKVYDEKPMQISKETRQADILEYLKHIRLKTGHGLSDSWHLLRISIGIE